MLLLVRHEPTQLNATGHPNQERLRGWIDAPLTADGLQKAEETAAEVKKFPITHLFASDLTRSRQTADPIVRATGVPASFHMELRPWNLGKLQGQLVSDVNPVIKKLVATPHVAAPGGESFNDFAKRFLGFAVPLLNRDDLVGMVTHIRNIKTLESVIAGKGTIDWKVWHEIPGVDPGGLVIASPTEFQPLTQTDRAEKGAGS